MTLQFAAADAAAIPIWFATPDSWAWIGEQIPASALAYAQATGFEPKPGRCCIAPDAKGRIAAVLFGLEASSTQWHDAFLPGKLPNQLPPGIYRFANAPHDATAGALAWLLGAYRFRTHGKADTAGPRLVAPAQVDAARIEIIAQSAALARDLINTPANDLGPAALEAAALKLAADHGATASVIAGEALLAKNFPLIHAVGRAAVEAPRLVDFSWGREGAPKVTLVGKGVCFDTGGLDLKPSSNMLLMKKDMGGAAAALAAAAMIMRARLNVRLRVLLPIVENSVSASAFRPGDIYPSRKGISVEIGNTDAEGRLILADALACASEDTPDLLLDFATLTGAARVALGPDLPPFYTDDDTLAQEIAQAGRAVNDPVWRMPLWPPYDSQIDGKISDLNSAPGGGFSGSIIAALFLRRFVATPRSWAHFDIYGWTPQSKPGRPEGGEAQAARLVFELVSARYGT